MEKVWDVLVIGSGPASLTCAIYTTRGAASTLVLAGENWGGQLMLTTKVDNFPGFPDGIDGPELMANMRKQTERFGAKIINKSVTNVDFIKNPREVFVKDEKFLARTVVIATGAQTVWLGVPGEKELIGRGVSTCAPCDAPFFKNKVVAVVGGGDTAMDEASVLTKYASKVAIIYRGDKFRATQIMQDKVLENPKIKIIWNTEVTKINGKDKVEGLGLRNNKTNQNSELKVDGVFIAIGHKPESEIFKGLIETDERGFIKIQEGSKTNVPGVFVAGDVYDYRYKQAITAAGFGCQAAMDALKYLEQLRVDK